MKIVIPVNLTEQLKDRINSFLNKEERSICYLSRKSGVSKTTISLFLKDKRIIHVKVYNKLDLFLSNLGY